MLSLTFHKNPERIGGGITELNYNGHRLIIDMGAELEYEGAEPNPQINLQRREISLYGIVNIFHSQCLIHSDSPIVNDLP